jgi:hypothetical protein
MRVIRGMHAGGDERRSVFAADQLPGRYLPRDSFPLRSTVYNVFRKFQRDGVWEAIWAELHMALRKRMRRERISAKPWPPSLPSLLSSCPQAARRGVGSGPQYTVTKFGKSDCEGTFARSVRQRRGCAVTEPFARVWLSGSDRPKGDFCWRPEDRSARLGKPSFDRAARFLSHRHLAVPRASELPSRATAGFVNLQIA